MISVGEPTGGSSASVFAVADPSGSEMNAHVASTRSRPLARVGLCESGVAKKGAGSTNARGPAELLRGTWAFQLWHFTERRRWWGRRHVSGGSKGATDGPDRTTSRLQSSTRHWGAEAPLTVRYAAHPSLLRAHRGAKFNAWTRSPWRNPSRRLAWSFRRWLCRRNLQY